MATITTIAGFAEQRMFVWQKRMEKVVPAHIRALDRQQKLGNRLQMQW